MTPNGPSAEVGSAKPLSLSDDSFRFASRHAPPSLISPLHTFSKSSGFFFSSAITRSDVARLVCDDAARADAA
jgi:hypothetical protein